MQVSQDHHKPWPVVADHTVKEECAHTSIHTTQQGDDAIPHFHYQNKSTINGFH